MMLMNVEKKESLMLLISKFKFVSHILRLMKRPRYLISLILKSNRCSSGDMPLMTENGTFIVNGTERVRCLSFTVHQVFFSAIKYQRRH